MRFEFGTAARIVFGAGSAREIAPAARALGSRALMVLGLPRGRAMPVASDLEEAGLHCSFFTVDGEPTVGLVRQGALQARDLACEVVIGFGGGSAIDTAKAIAALVTNEGDPLEYLEVIGQGRPIAFPSAPFIAVPTTAGTGSEVTKNAVLAAPEHRVKASMRSSHMLARVAVVDPELTLDLPPAITASTGLDALTQLIEPYVSSRPNPMTDSLCLEGIRRVTASLVRAWEDGHNLAARTDMALASLFGGLALANAGLGAVHGFAAPIGGMFDAPHGAVCAALLPHVMDANIRALRVRAPDALPIARYRTVARLLTQNPAADADAGVGWVMEVCRKLEMPPLSAYGISRTEIPILVEKGAQASSMKGNPIALTADEMGEILTRAL